MSELCIIGVAERSPGQFPWTRFCSSEPILVMVDRINEPDWKLFRTLHPVALGRFCQRVLAEIAQINADVRKSHHERYLEIWEVLTSRGSRGHGDIRRQAPVYGPHATRHDPIWRTAER